MAVIHKPSANNHRPTNKQLCEVRSSGFFWTLTVPRRRATTYDNKNPHPLREEIFSLLKSTPWVIEYAIRLRDEGQVFYAEVFVTPLSNSVTLEQLQQLSQAVNYLDWKIQDVVVIPIRAIPHFADQ